MRLRDAPMIDYCSSGSIDPAISVDEVEGLFIVQVYKCTR